MHKKALGKERHSPLDESQSVGHDSQSRGLLHSNHVRQLQDYLEFEREGCRLHVTVYVVQVVGRMITLSDIGHSPTTPGIMRPSWIAAHLGVAPTGKESVFGGDV